GTSHNLGQGFARAFDIKYLDEDNVEKHPWGTSWGVSTRLIGALVMTHGDDHGLFLPPKVAPIQAVVVPVLFGKNDEAVLAECRRVSEQLVGLRVKVDDDPKQTAGWKYNQYEMLGVPVRIEIGPRDVQQGQVVLVPRNNAGKRFVKLAELKPELEKLLDEVQTTMYQAAFERLQDMTQEASSFDEFKQKLEKRPGFILVHWCGSQVCENRIIDETKTTPRVMVPEEQDKTEGPCIACGSRTTTRIYYARTY
ncbi:MAG: His/Gly/Thr/Pro-type tRNA ligase C-terminal domain-containing protein, partial [candidate division WOR-3 bacterium]